MGLLDTCAATDFAVVALCNDEGSGRKDRKEAGIHVVKERLKLMQKAGDWKLNTAHVQTYVNI